MATPQEILQEMIDAAPAASEAIETSIAQIQVQIDTFQEKQDAMKTGVGNEAASRLESYLIGTKYTPVEDYHQYKGPTYNAIETAGGTITDWKIYERQDLTGLNYISNITFECEGDQTLIFATGVFVAFTLVSPEKTYSKVVSSSYDAGTDKTEVEIEDGVLTAALSEALILKYTYSLGDDTTVDEIKTQWDFAHDYIVTPLGLATGTYGTQDNIAKLTDAKNMLATNKAKVDNSVAVFNEFV
jgi:hypothetical protein